MAEKFRSLQIFRNDAPFVLDALGIDGLKGYIQGLLEGENPKLSLNDGEPISIRYKKSQDDNSVHCINGIAYNDGTNTTILWDELNIVTIPQNSTDTDFVTLSHTVNLDGTITFTVSNTLGDFNTVNGLATTEAVKTYVTEQLSAFSPDAITAVEGGETDFVSVSVSDKDTDGKVVVTANVTTADTIDNEGLATASLVKSYVEGAIETAVGSIVIPELPEYTITPLKNAEEGYLKTYQLFKGGEAVEGSKINIPKDYLVKSASIIDVTEENPKEDLIAGKYIDFVINTQNNDGNVEHLYINVTDLVDVYVAGKDISITDNNAINVSLSNAITPNTTVGFVNANTTIEAGSSLEDILRKILVKEVLATSVNPTNSLSVSGDAKREVGTALGTVTLTPSYTDGYYKSEDTSVYTDIQFNKNNTDAIDGKLNAGCTPGAITYYKGTATITDQVSEEDGFQYVDNTTTTKNETYSFQIQTVYSASTVNKCKTSSNAVQEISIDGGTTSKSDAKTVKFYHKTYVSSIQGLVWDAAQNCLVKDGVEYVPSVELKNTMSEKGAFLTSKEQNKSQTYTIPGASSLCVIVPQNVIFSTYLASDTSKTDLFGDAFKKSETTNDLGIKYDIYIYPNNGGGEFALTGLTYSSIE